MRKLTLMAQFDEDEPFEAMSFIDPIEDKVTITIPLGSNVVFGYHRYDKEKTLTLTVKEEVESSDT